MSVCGIEFKSVTIVFSYSVQLQSSVKKQNRSVSEKFPGSDTCSSTRIAQFDWLSFEKFSTFTMLETEMFGTSRGDNGIDLLWHENKNLTCSSHAASEIRKVNKRTCGVFFICLFVWMYVCVCVCVCVCAWKKPELHNALKIRLRLNDSFSSK